MLSKIFITLLSFSFINAVENGEEATSTDTILSRNGTVRNTGTTFATKVDAENAIQRGQEDYSKNPFVQNVCLLTHPTEIDGRSTRAIITQIAPNIYLCCKHTAAALQASSNYFQISNYEGFEIELFPCPNEPGNLKKLLFLNHDNPNVDLALIKLEFDAAPIPPCEFLQLASPIKEGETGKGIVVSCGDVSIANQGEIFNPQARVVSIHEIKKQGNILTTCLHGYLNEEKRSEMHQHASMLVETMKKNDARSQIAQDALKIVLETAQAAIFEFPTPNPDAKNQSEKLKATLGMETSGAPFVVKQQGTYKLLGMVTRGAFKPEGISSKEIRFTPENIRNVLHEVVFLDLTTYSDWIGRGIAGLSRK